MTSLSIFKNQSQLVAVQISENFVSTSGPYWAQLPGFDSEYDAGRRVTILSVTPSPTRSHHCNLPVKITV